MQKALNGFCRCFKPYNGGGVSQPTVGGEGSVAGGSPMKKITFYMISGEQFTNEYPTDIEYENICKYLANQLATHFSKIQIVCGEETLDPKSFQDLINNHDQLELTVVQIPMPCPLDKYAKQFGWLTLMNASPELKNDREFVQAAAQRAVCELAYASYELKNDREFMMSAVQHAVQHKNSSEALHYASDELKKDREFVRAVVQKCGYSLSYAADDLKNDKEIVMAAVQQNGHSLSEASDDLKDDEEIVLASVQKNGKALKYASPRLKTDKKTVMAAAKNNPEAMLYTSNDLRKDAKIKEVILENHPWVRPQYITGTTFIRYV